MNLTDVHDALVWLVAAGLPGVLYSTYAFSLPV